MRGLKLLELVDAKSAPVASFTDAWIETISEGVIERPETSHLLQMRGLKLFLLIILKSISLVASFTDAWIETEGKALNTVFGYVASFTDAWIETQSKCNIATFIIVASFTDAWIETF